MFNRSHFYLTFGGGLLTGAEEWQTGVHFAPTGTPSDADILEALDQISLADIFDDLAVIIEETTLPRYPTVTTMTWVKLAAISVNGTYLGAPTTYQGSAAGTYALTAGTPSQLASVVTLETGQVFGKARRGRMYWPAPADFTYGISTATGQVTENAASVWATKLAAQLLAVQGEVSTVLVPAQLAVMSPSGTGTTNLVTQIGVGRILDTQRRRRGDLIEDHQFVPYV